MILTVPQTLQNISPMPSFFIILTDSYLITITSILGFSYWSFRWLFYFLFCNWTVQGDLLNCEPCHTSVWALSMDSTCSGLCYVWSSCPPTLLRSATHHCSQNFPTIFMLLWLNLQLSVSLFIQMITSFVSLTGVVSWLSLPYIFYFSFQSEFITSFLFSC